MARRSRFCFLCKPTS
ncbi:hypothetical protein D039_4745A, partial [Vibrio parahaemolyticus EKP-028]